MEVENGSRTNSCNKVEDMPADDTAPLPGFRFHPTDEELVGFYLRRKVDKKPIRLELIKQADIYKYDPWDLPSMSTESNNGGDKEWYFFCRRGRKYKNSIRPNRVTGSGFWKATGIDRPIYSSSSGDGAHCIGLKKSLVYYRGSAGKGTKTDWMMHEFRLPPTHDHKSAKTSSVDAKNLDLEAEVWTLCRILKRNISHRKMIPNWREMAPKRNNGSGGGGIIINPGIDGTGAVSETCSIESCDYSQSNYISFTGAAAPMTMMNQIDKKPYNSVEAFLNQQFHHLQSAAMPAVMTHQTPASMFSGNMCADINDLLRHAEWEDLQAIAGGAAVPSLNNNPFYL